MVKKDHEVNESFYKHYKYTCCKVYTLVKCWLWWRHSSVETLVCRVKGCESEQCAPVPFVVWKFIELRSPRFSCTLLEDARRTLFHLFKYYFNIHKDVKFSPLAEHLVFQTYNVFSPKEKSSNYIFYFWSSGEQGSAGPPGLRGPIGPPGDNGLPGKLSLISLWWNFFSYINIIFNG